MSQQRDDAEWLKLGRQRAAVARGLRKPMTGAELCSAARTLAPRIQLRDIWHLLHQMRQRDLAVCLTPRLVTGRLYCFNAKGRSAVHHAFGIPISEPLSNIDWRKYSQVVRAAVRRHTLIGLGQIERNTGQAQTATTVRKHVLPEHGVGLNPVIRALKDLMKAGLLHQDGFTAQRCCKLYRLTPAGKRVLEQLQR